MQTPSNQVEESIERLREANNVSSETEYSCEYAQEESDPKQQIEYLAQVGGFALPPEPRERSYVIRIIETIFAAPEKYDISQDAAIEEQFSLAFDKAMSALTKKKYSPSEQHDDLDSSIITQLSTVVSKFSVEKRKSVSLKLSHDISNDVQTLQQDKNRALYKVLFMVTHGMPAGTRSPIDFIRKGDVYMPFINQMGTTYLAGKYDIEVHLDDKHQESELGGNTILELWCTVIYNNPNKSARNPVVKKRWYGAVDVPKNCSEKANLSMKLRTKTEGRAIRKVLDVLGTGLTPTLCNAEAEDIVGAKVVDEE